MPDASLTPKYYPAPKTAAEYRSNLWLARLRVGQTLGYDWSAGSPAEFAALTPDQQQTFTDALSAYVVARPTVFDPVAVEAARRRLSNTGVFGVSLADNSATAALTEFRDEVANNAEALATAFPRVLVGLLALAVVAFIAVKYLPDSIAKARAS